MNKSQFFARLKKRALVRYEMRISNSQIDNLIDEGMIQKGTRVGTAGKRQIYYYGSAAYRRALQIIRFRSRGIVRHDEIRVMLFLWGYGVPVWEVRGALLNVYLASAKSIRSQIRSAYADNSNPIPPKHKLNLERQLGVIDPRLVAAGYTLPSSQIIQALRGAKQKSVDEANIRKTFAAVREMPSFPQEHFTKTAEVVSPLLNGVLQFDDDSVGASDGQSIEQTIRQASDSTYLLARDFFNRLRQKDGMKLLLTNASEAEVAKAERAVSDSLKWNPFWAASIFSFSLFLTSATQRRIGLI